MKAATPMAGKAVTREDAARQLLDFGESYLPVYFPSHQPTGSFPPFAYRYYPETGIYLGVVVTDGLGYTLDGVYVMGGAFGSAPQYVGKVTDFVTPFQVENRLSAGRNYTLGLRSDGRVLVWGDGVLGGAGTPVPGTVATVVDGLRNIVAVQAAANYSTDTNNQIALDAAGTVWGWGYNFNGEIGSFPTSSTGALVAVPQPISQLGTATAITHCGLADKVRVFALHADGTVWFTPGTRTNGVVTSKQVPGLTGVVALGENREQLCANQMAIRADGSVWRFALDEGYVNPSWQYTVAASPVGNLPPVTQVSCSENHCLALATDKSVWAWGQNFGGQLGNGTYEGRTIPFKIPGLANVRKVIAGQSDVSFAVTEGGGLFGWGRIMWTDEINSDPVAPRRLFGEGAGVVDFSVGSVGNHFVVLMSDGTVKGWGNNERGELGDGTTARRVQPVDSIGIDLF